jgi:hypothetical protein
MARLLGWTPIASAKLEPSRIGRLFESDDADGVALAEMDRSASIGRKEISTPSHQWKGSGLGTEWDERVGAGAAAASIRGRLVFSAWKIISEEDKRLAIQSGGSANTGAA